MKKYLEIFQNSALFRNMSSDGILSALTCFNPAMQKIDKGGNVFYNREIKMGILLDGRLQNIQIDYKGNQNIIKNFAPSDVFGEAVVCAEVKTAPINLIAVEDSTVLFFDYNKVLNACSNACVFHLQILKNLIKILAEKNLFFTRKLQHITKRSTREKVMSYLGEQSKLCESKVFSIPFNRQELADYLSVERSALSAELSKLQNENIISYHKNSFSLTTDNYV